MAKSRNLFAALLIVLTFLFVSLKVLSVEFENPLPDLNSFPIPRYAILDISSFITGLRSVGADIAWIQLLQYYGTPEKPLDKETEYRLSIDMVKHLIGMRVEHAHGGHDEDHAGAGKHKHEHRGESHSHYHASIEGGVYPDLLKYCYRIINLDPFFFYVYLYGAGALAWNLDRPNEALELLQEGIIRMEKYRSDITKDISQPYWQLNLYISAIIYREKGEYGKMLNLLDRTANLSETPNIMRVMLANIYEKERNYKKSLFLWIKVYETGDPQYYDKAENKINELKKY